ncbi:MAG: hypothetical protein JNM86_10515 [Phycisphaerae bacterium]|nr:hypothetical protein [Phycisphaerae bacterium]MBN8599011.1 hypothetical protein [Planctomycetota bacterium]
MSEMPRVIARNEVPFTAGMRLAGSRLILSERPNGRNDHFALLAPYPLVILGIPIVCTSPTSMGLAAFALGFGAWVVLANEFVTQDLPVRFSIDDRTGEIEIRETSRFWRRKARRVPLAQVRLVRAQLSNELIELPRTSRVTAFSIGLLFPDGSYFPIVARPSENRFTRACRVLGVDANALESLHLQCPLRWRAPYWFRRPLYTRPISHRAVRELRDVLNRIRQTHEPASPGE